MKKLIFYYSIIMLPLLVIFSMPFWSDNLYFMTALLLYVFLFRPLADSYRLIDKGVISKKEIWKAFFQVWTFKYFKELYLP